MVKKVLKSAGPFVLAIVAAAVIAVVVVELRDSGGDSGSSGFEPPIPAVEYLYLDGDRVLEYLAEVEGGEVGSVKRISQEIRKVEAGVAQGPFNVGASAQHVNSAESTVVRTKASALGLLIKKLEDAENDFVDYHDVTLSRAQDAWDIREGMLVKFVTHSLLSPGYIRPYVVVRQSATLSALFPRGTDSATAAGRAAKQQQRAESFARQVGPNPRLTFAVSPPPHEGAKKRLKILLPMSYSGLTEERSLLEKGPDEFTGGRLVVFGKVIRLFKHRVHCDENVCFGRRQPEYTDYATRETWRHPLEGASNYLIEHVSHSCLAHRSEIEKRELHRMLAGPIPQLKGRACFLRKLKRQTELYAPGAVILPIAIWK
jgi:hypothetical protein